ncbi:MAG: Rid family hydrolase [Pseudomonadota bacterium]
MSKRSIIPAEMQPLYDDWHMSPGLECEGFVFLTGVNGVAIDGTVSPDAAEQIETAFTHVKSVLLQAGLSFDDIVEVTSYHVGIRQHLQAFRDIWKRLVTEPYPAWTAIEVAGFASEGVVIELRVIARRAE